MPGGFNITSGEPIDSRMIVNEISQILEPGNWTKVKPYNGLVVSSKDGQVRVCIDAQNYTNPESWKEIGGNSGNITELENNINTLDEMLSLTANKLKDSSGFDDNLNYIPKSNLIKNNKNLAASIETVADEFNKVVYIEDTGSEIPQPDQTTADRAVSDANGNVITETYATKTELDNVAYLETEGEIIEPSEIITADRSVGDKLGNDITNTYATKIELGNITPAISENSTWVINGKDTGLPSRGADGVSLGEIALEQTLSTNAGSENKVISQKVISEKLMNSAYLIDEGTTTDYSSILVADRAIADSDGNIISETYLKKGSGSGGESYELPIASSTVLGGVKIGNGLNIGGDGTLSVISNTPTVNWDDINGKPDTFKPETHNHNINEVTNLETTLNNKSDKITKVSETGTSITKTISPNTFYEFGEVTTLNLTLGNEVDGILNEFLFVFTSGTSTPTNLTINPTPKWIGGNPVIETSKKYIVSIVSGLAVIGGA